HDVLADGEVDQRAGGLRAVVAVAGHLDGAHAVGLTPGGLAGHRGASGNGVRVCQRLTPPGYYLPPLRGWDVGQVANLSRSGCKPDLRAAALPKFVVSLAGA